MARGLLDWTVEREEVPGDGMDSERVRKRSDWIASFK